MRRCGVRSGEGDDLTGGDLCDSCGDFRNWDGCGKELDPPRGSDVRSSPDGSVTVTVPCDETSGELP